MKFVVDTNVPLTANGKAEQVSLLCVGLCARKLREIMRQHILVLDDAWHIIKEYKNRLHSSGQPGPGDAFLRWVLTNWANPERCALVHITPYDLCEDERDFEEFPHTHVLSGFDRSDRKFVAVALTHPETPPVLNATDSDWWDYREVLADHGVMVKFICPDMAFMQEIT